MITQEWLTARIDQTAAELRGQAWTTEEIAMLAVANGLEWAAMVLRMSLQLDPAERVEAAAQLERLRSGLVGEESTS